MEGTGFQAVDGGILEEQAVIFSTENSENDEFEGNETSFSSEVHENGNLKKNCIFEVFYVYQF